MTVQEAILPPCEMQWEVDGIRIAGLKWEGTGTRRVLALHGWLDHAESFAELAPQIAASEFIALDLPGHGLSGHRSPDATYALWDDIPQILGVVDQLGWDDFTLLGHSRGAMICVLLAALRPERINALVVLDALMPPAVREDEVVKQMRQFLDDTARAKRSKRSFFTSPEQFVRRRQVHGQPPETGERLLTRAIAAEDGGYRVRGDPRLHAASVMKFTAAQIEAVFRAIQAPTLAVWADEGLGNTQWSRGHRQRISEITAGYQEVVVPGHHHWHLDEAVAPVIAGHINRFLDTTSNCLVAAAV